MLQESGPRHGSSEEYFYGHHASMRTPHDDLIEDSFDLLLLEAERASWKTIKEKRNLKISKREHSMQPQVSLTATLVVTNNI